jgi:hypothetical protein
VCFSAVVLPWFITVRAAGYRVWGSRVTILIFAQLFAVTYNYCTYCIYSCAIFMSYLRKILKPHMPFKYFQFFSAEVYWQFCATAYSLLYIPSCHILHCKLQTSYNQSCKWNERSLNRGLNRGRGLGSDMTFFWASCSNLEIDENFRISHKLGLGLAGRFLKHSRSSSIAFEANTHPAQLPTPQKKLNWCGSHGSLDS